MYEHRLGGHDMKSEIKWKDNLKSIGTDKRVWPFSSLMLCGFNEIFGDILFPLSVSIVKISIEESVTSLAIANLFLGLKARGSPSFILIFSSPFSVRK